MKEALHWGVVVAGVTAHQNDRPVGLGTEITISAWMKARRPNDQSRDHRQYLEPVEAAGTFGTHKVALPLGRVPDNDDNHLRKIPSAPHRRDDPRLQPVSDRGLAIFIAALAAALVLGYLFVNKLADMSSEEDCALAHRKNCGAVELSR